MQDNFNKAAPSAASDDKQPLADLRVLIQNARENINMIAAAQKGDWERVRATLDSGAALTIPVVQELVKDTSPKAVALMQSLQHPSFPKLAAAPLLLGAMKNDLALVNEILKQGHAAQDDVESALFSALRRGHHEIADRLLPLLPPDNYSDKVLVALLLNDPLRYDTAMTAQKEPRDELIHFVNACAAKDTGAIDHMIDRMIARKAAGSAPLIAQNINAFLLYEDLMTYLLQSGYTQAIDRYIDNLREICPPVSSLLHAAALQEDDAALFTHLLEKLKPAETEIPSIAHYTSSAKMRPYLKATVKAFPALQTRHSDLMLVSALSANDVDDFFERVNNGTPLPTTEDGIISLLRHSLAHQQKEVTDYILKEVPPTPTLIKKMQGQYFLCLAKKGAELANDWRSDKDKIFWQAAESGTDADVLAHFENVTDIHPAYNHHVGSAVAAVIKRGDDALLDHILAHANWSENSEAAAVAHRACLVSPQTAEKASLLVDATAPRLLQQTDLRVMAGDHFPAVLAVLEKQGFPLTDDFLMQALSLGLREENIPMVECLLERGLSLALADDELKASIHHAADISTLNILEKWAAREKTISAALPADLSDKNSLFRGTDSPAIQAAYSNQFAKIMAGADENFDPQLLVTTKDAVGNSVLDILGAHGKLNDVLLAAVWKNKNAAEFICKNAPLCYQAQCDFNGLNARIHQTHLQERGKNRLVLKKKA